MINLLPNMGFIPVILLCFIIGSRAMNLTSYTYSGVTRIMCTVQDPDSVMMYSGTSGGQIIQWNTTDMSFAIFSYQTKSISALVHYKNSLYSASIDGKINKMTINAGSLTSISTVFSSSSLNSTYDPDEDWVTDIRVYS